MNFISFGLWGTLPKYWQGAIVNVVLAKEWYPGWTCRFYVDGQLPKVYKVLEELGAEVILADSTIPPMFWRFLVNDDPIMDRFISRDSDSRIGLREVLAVNAWIKSSYPVHSMRDHPAHGRGMNGGMWGAVAGALPHMEKSIRLWLEKHKNVGEYQYDQDFLCQVIYPLVHKNTLCHDSFYRNDFWNSVPFPRKRTGHRFVGEVFDENNQPRPRDWEAIPPDS